MSYSKVNPGNPLIRLIKVQDKIRQAFALILRGPQCDSALCAH